MMRQIMRLSRRETLFLAAAMLLMAAQCLPWIMELGIEYDEAHFLETATRIVAKDPQVLRPPDGFSVQGRPFPFMTMAYVGALDGWLMALPVSLFGFHQAVPRVFNLLIGCVVLWLTYLLGRRYGGPLAGGIAVGMLVVDLEFLLHVPVHYGPFFLQMICAVAVLLMLEEWIEEGRPRHFYWACFWGGLAFQEKLTFVWVLGLLVVMLLIFRGREIFVRLTPKQFFIGFAIFLLATLPALWYVIGHRDFVFGFGQSVSNTPTADNVKRCFAMFDLLLTGQQFMKQQLGATPGFARFSALQWLLWSAVILALVQRQWKALALLSFSVALVLLNALFADGGRLHHLLLAYPLMQVGVGTAFARWRRGAAIAGVLIVATGVSTAQNIAWYTAEVRRTGGGYFWSSASYDVAAWMRSEPDKSYIATAWGLQRPLHFLTAGRVAIGERYFELLLNPIDANTRRQLEQLARRRETFWLSSRIAPEFQSNLDKMFEIARGQGLEPRMVREFYKKTGEPIFQVYSFRPAEQAPPWRSVEGRFAAASAIEVRLPPGAHDVRFRLGARKWNRAKTMRIELAGPDGKWYAAWWRSLEVFQMVWPEKQLQFGNDLFPDRFVPVEGTRVGEEARFLRIFVETAGKPVDVAVTDLEVR